MGEIAEMMLNGMLCECCAVAVGDEVGYPRRCDDCKPEGEETNDDSGIDTAE